MKPTLAVDLGSGPQPANPFEADRVIGVDANSQGPDVISCWIGLEPLPIQSSTVDVVTAFDFLEHLPRAVWRDGVVVNTFIETMSEVWRILKPQGLFVARTPAFPPSRGLSGPHSCECDHRHDCDFCLRDEFSNEQGDAGRCTQDFSPILGSVPLISR